MIWTPERKGLGFPGNVNIKVRPVGWKVPALEFNRFNTLTNGGRSVFAKILGTPGGYDAGDVYLALGTVNIAPEKTDTQLYAEYYRSPAGLSFEDGTLIFENLVNNIEAVQTPPDQVEEMGLFWDGASVTPNSGTMIARVLTTPSFTKTASDEVEVYWSYRVVEAYEDLAER